MERPGRGAPGAAEPGDDAPHGGEVGEPHGRGRAAKGIPDLAGEAVKGRNRQPIGEGGLGEGEPDGPRGTPVGGGDNLEAEGDNAPKLGGREARDLGTVPDRREEPGGEDAVGSSEPRRLEGEALAAAVNLEETGLPDPAGARGGAGSEEAEIAAEVADRRAGRGTVGRAEKPPESADVSLARADGGGLVPIGAKAERALELVEEGDPGSLDGLDDRGRRPNNLELSVVDVSA